MDPTKFIKLCCLIWALTGKDSSATNITKNFDLDSLISNMFGNHGGYPGNSQGYPSGDQKPQYQEPSDPLNSMNPGANYPGYPSNGYQGNKPQYQRPGTIMNDYRPGYNQGRPSQGGYPQYQRPNNNMYLGNNPGYNRPENYQRPNQINNPQGNVWNNANENQGMNYPGGSQFFPGNSAQNPLFQRPGEGFSGNPSNGLPVNYRPRPGFGNNWINRNPNSNFYPNSQARPGMDWNNPNEYPNNQYPNQISVPGNQIQTQGVDRQGFDQQNPGLIQGQPIQYPRDFHNYRPGLQNGGLFNPSQGPNGLNNQLPGLQNTPNFEPTSNYHGLQNGQLHKNRPQSTNTTEKVTILGSPSGISSLSSPNKSPSRMKQCVQDCSSSTDYSPRCGTDNVTYFNEEKVQCARKCGFVETTFYENCPVTFVEAISFKGLFYTFVTFLTETLTRCANN